MVTNCDSDNFFLTSHGLEMQSFYITAFQMAISLVSFRHVTQHLNVFGRRAEPGRAAARTPRHYMPPLLCVEILGTSSSK